MSPGPDNGRHFLLPHPVSERGALQGLVQELSVIVAGPDDGTLSLVYQLTGELEALQLPEPRTPARTDGLWRHTCFEAFIAPTGASEYAVRCLGGLPLLRLPRGDGAVDERRAAAGPLSCRR
jgi:hypothetical protein